MRKTLLTTADYTLFYKSIIYGKIDDSIMSSIKSAYKDLCRTITGFSKQERHNAIFNNASKVIYDEINLLLLNQFATQEEFDTWHKSCCDKLINSFENQKFYYGQAQKWINMSLKNLSMLEHELVEIFSKLQFRDFRSKINGKIYSFIKRHKHKW